MTEDNESRLSSDETNAVSQDRKMYDDLKAHFTAAGSGVVGEFEEGAWESSQCFVTCGTRRCRILFAAGGAAWLSFQDEVALVDKGSENLAMTFLALPFAEVIKAIELWVAGASLEDLQRHWPSVRPSLAGAYAFLDYFDEQGRFQPDEQHWLNGAAVCRSWVQLLRTGATQADIDAVVDRLNAEPDPGHGWGQLTGQFFHWARARGFTVKTGEVD